MTSSNPENPPPPVRSADYGPLAPVYLLLTALLTAGGALRTQRRLLHHVRPGDRVLQVGCGPGDFNVDLARSGAVVTYVDIAPAMVARARRRVEEAVGAEHPHRFLVADLTRMSPDERYDVVIAAFFLNTFSWQDCLAVLDHLCARVEPGGLLCIADETRSENATLAWMLDRSRPVVLWIYGLFTGQPVHGLYDYDPELIARGWQVVDRQRDARDYLEATAWRRGGEGD